MGGRRVHSLPSIMRRRVCLLQARRKGERGFYKPLSKKRGKRKVPTSFGVAAGEIQRPLLAPGEDRGKQPRRGGRRKRGKGLRFSME